MVLELTIDRLGNSSPHRPSWNVSLSLIHLGNACLCRV